MEAILRRDKTVVIAGLITITAMAWAYLVYDARSKDCMKMMAWNFSTAWWMFAMWSVMMAAMMVPSVAPMALTFAMVNRTRRAQARPYVPTMLFLAGYLAVWTAFSALATAAQWGLQHAALVSHLMVMTSPLASGLLLIAAGLFQLTPLKRACLTHCQTPFSFIMTEWREGRWGAVVMGLRHGGFCVGCCWFLMGLLFVAGVMNLVWVAAISAMVLAEKIAPPRLHVSTAAGLAFVGWGMALGAGLLRLH